MTLGQAVHAWDAALDKLVDTHSGRYSWAVYVGADTKPLQSEDGGFSLDPLQSSFDRILDSPDGEYVAHVKRLGSTSYLQIKDWGTWSGCWLRMTNEMLERQTGVKFSNSVPLPVSVIAVTDATITRTAGSWFGAPYREYLAEVGAAEALQFLGISAAVYAKSIEKLNRIMVPITISLDTSGRIHGGGARGSEVAAALAASHPGLTRRLMEFLPEVRASFALRDLGSKVAVAAPRNGSILPGNAGKNATCAAKDPHV